MGKNSHFSSKIRKSIIVSIKKDIFHFILNVFEPDFHMTCSKSRIFSQTIFIRIGILSHSNIFPSKVPEIWLIRGCCRRFGVLGCGGSHEQYGGLIFITGSVYSENPPVCWLTAVNRVNHRHLCGSFIV